MLRRLLFVLLFLVLPSAGAAACRQALALGLDVSASVDAGEYRLQLDGLAAALGHEAVAGALLAMADTPVEVVVYEWSGQRYQQVILPWTRIESRAALEQVILVLLETGRSAVAEGGGNDSSKYSGADVMRARRANDPSTAVGSAMLYGASLLARRDCWARTLDLSGDGTSNVGPHPRDVKLGARLDGITVNALVVGADAPRGDDIRQVEIAELSTYFEAEVIRGPHSFVETALGFSDYEAAMARKLLRELSELNLSSLPRELRADQ